MNVIVRVADERDWEAIACLNHDTYAMELGQHAVREDGRKTDRLHETNVYIVAYVGDELAGMLSMTLPSCAEFSTLKRVKQLSSELQENLQRCIEVRLLAVKPQYRGTAVFHRLVLAITNYCREQGYVYMLISAISNRIRLYELMGFQAIAEPVQEGTAVYVPMSLTRADFDASPYYQKLCGLAGLAEMA